MIRLRKYHIYLAVVVGLSLFVSLTLVLEPATGGIILYTALPALALYDALGKILPANPGFVLAFMLFLVYCGAGFLPLLGALYFKRKPTKAICIIFQALFIALHYFILWRIMEDFE